jgi:hypothetical protein
LVRELSFVFNNKAKTSLYYQQSIWFLGVFGAAEIRSAFFGGNYMHDFMHHFDEDTS